MRNINKYAQDGAVAMDNSALEEFIKANGKTAESIVKEISSKAPEILKAINMVVPFSESIIHICYHLFSDIYFLINFIPGCLSSGLVANQKHGGIGLNNYSAFFFILLKVLHIKNTQTAGKL